MTDLEQWKEASGKEVSLGELDVLVTDLFEVGKQYDELEAKKKERGQAYEELQGKILLILQQAGKSKYSVDGVGSISVANKYVIRVPKEISSIRECRAWFMLHKGPDVTDGYFKPNSQALTAFYNAEKEASNDPMFSIPGVEAPTLVQTLRFKSEKV